MVLQSRYALETFRFRGAVDTLPVPQPNGLTVYEDLFLKDFLPKTPHYLYGTVESCETVGARLFGRNAMTTGSFGYIVPSGGHKLWRQTDPDSA